jgi:hypothetical protein
MASKISYDVLDAQQHCRFKAYLRLSGEEGIKSDFETLLFNARQELRVKAIEKVRRREVESGVILSRATLRKGIPLFSRRTSMTIITQSNSMDSRGSTATRPLATFITSP